MCFPFKKKNILGEISPKIDEQLKAVSHKLEEKLRLLENRHAAAGTFRSGNFLHNLKQMLIEHFNDVLDMICLATTTHVKENAINIDSNQIFNLLKELSNHTKEQLQNTLKKSIKKQNVSEEQEKRISDELNLLAALNAELRAKSQKCSLELIPDEAIKISKTSNKIALGSLLIALVALIVSILKE